MSGISPAALSWNALTPSTSEGANRQDGSAFTDAQVSSTTATPKTTQPSITQADVAPIEPNTSSPFTTAKAWISSWLYTPESTSDSIQKELVSFDDSLSPLELLRQRRELHRQGASSSTQPTSVAEESDSTTNIAQAAITTAACIATGVNPKLCAALGIITSAQPSEPISMSVVNERKFDNNGKEQSSYYDDRAETSRYSSFHTKNIDHNLEDTDGDGIPDEWEIKGYTVVKGKIEKWGDAQHASKQKYYSNPYDPRTAGEPYTDSQKALNILPAGLPEECRNPMVQCFPQITVALEEVHLEEGDEYLESVTSEKSIAKMEEVSDEHSISVGISAEFGTDRSALTISTEYGYAHSSTRGTEESTTQSNTREENVDTLDHAKVKAEVRIRNDGKAPAYNVKTTSNMYFTDGEHSRTLATIKTDKTTEAQAIMPKSSYPNEGQHGMVLSRESDMISNSHLVLSLGEFEALMEAGGKIVFETIQSDALFARVDPRDRAMIVLPEQKWNHYLPEIKQKSAVVGIVTNKEDTKYHYVAGADTEPDSDYIPTVRTILASLLNARTNADGNLTFKHQHKECDLTIDNLIISMPNKLKKRLDVFSSQNYGKSILDFPIQPQDKLNVALPCYTNSLSSSSDLKHFPNFVRTAHGISASYDYNPAIALPKHLFEHFGSYVLSYQIKSSTAQNINVKIGGTSMYPSEEFAVHDAWTRHEIKFTFLEGNGASKFYFKLPYESSIQLKDMKLHRVDDALGSKVTGALKRVNVADRSTTIDSITFAKKGRQDIGAYIVQSNGKFLTRIGTIPSQESEVTLDLHKHKLAVSSPFQVFANSFDNPNSFKLVASYSPREDIVFDLKASESVHLQSGRVRINTSNIPKHRGEYSVTYKLICLTKENFPSVVLSEENASHIQGQFNGQIDYSDRFIVVKEASSSKIVTNATGQKTSKLLRHKHISTEFTGYDIPEIKEEFSSLQGVLESNNQSFSHERVKLNLDEETGKIIITNPHGNQIYYIDANGYFLKMVKKKGLSPDQHLFTIKKQTNGGKYEVTLDDKNSQGITRRLVYNQQSSSIMAKDYYDSVIIDSQESDQFVSFKKAG